METPSPRRFASVIPNALTALRLVLAGLFPLVAPPWRLWVVLLAGASDALDGWLARRFGGTSWLGAVLDAVADKAFTVVVLGTLTWEGRLALWHTGLLLSRDVVVALIYAYVVLTRQWGVFRRVGVRLPGKITTVLLFASMVLLLSAPRAAMWVVWPAMVLSAAAAVDYAVVFGRALAARRAAR